MIENPYQYNSPVSIAARFTGRREAIAFVQQHLVGGHQANALAIFGGPQMGKSSLLRQLPHHLDERYCAIRLSLRAGTVAGEQAWLSALASAVPDAIALLNIQSARLPDLPVRPSELRAALLGEYMAEGLHSLRRDRHLLILIDNAERLLIAVQQGALPKDSFAFLAQLLTAHSHLDLLMAFDARYESDVLAVGAPFDPALTYRLGPLPREELATALTDPVAGILDYEDTALDAIYELTAGHPYLAQVIGWLLFEQSEARGHAEPIGAADVDAVTDRAVALAGDTLGAAWAHGTPQERLVLTALSNLSPAEPPTPVSREEIGAWLAEAGHPLDPRTVNAAWRRLEYEGVVALAVDGKLVVVGGLRRRWLRGHVALPAPERRSLPWKRVAVVVAAVLALIVLLAVLSALPGPGGSVDAGATITLNLDLQATDNAYFATQTATAR